MPSTLPEGEPAPADGSLPRVGARRAWGSGRSGSTCTCRSARCAAATATSTPTPPSELGDAPGASRASYAEAAVAEVRLARTGARRRSTCRCRHGLLRRRHADPAAAAATCRGGGRVDDEFGLAAGRRGDHRVQPGQRHRRRPGRAARGRHQPGLVRHAVGGAARAARCSTAPTTRSGCRGSCSGRARPGFEQVSLDLIYGTPGESLADWATSLDAALACEPDHVSAYALIVEDGTALARQVRRGEVADDRRRRPGRQVPRSPTRRSTAAGLRLVRGVQLGARPQAAGAGTTWPTGPAATGGASGPGAHSHVGGVRWWNVKHPAAYADAARAQGVSPAHAREVLDDETRRVERVLLETRLRRGAAASTCSTTPAGRGCPAWWPRARRGAGRRPRSC